MSVTKWNVASLFLSLSLLASGPLRAEVETEVKPANASKSLYEMYDDVREGETFLWVLESAEGHEVLVEENFQDGQWDRKLHVMTGATTDGAEGSDRQSDITFRELSASELAKIEAPKEPSAWSSFLRDTLKIPEKVGLGLGSLSFETDRLKIKGGFKMPPREERDQDAVWYEVLRAEVGFTIKF
jgi:hypothetical protein